MSNGSGRYERVPERERALRKRRMTDDSDELDEHRWSQDMTQETKRTELKAEDLDGWTDSWIYLFTPSTGRVGVQGVFCICFRIELITGTHETSRRNCVGVQIETLDPMAVT